MQAVDCGCKLGWKCADHAYCAEGEHAFSEYSYGRWVGGKLQHVTVRQCVDCDRHESEVV